MRLPLPRSALLALTVLLAAGRATADTSPRRMIEALLQPDRVERATLSPDGRQLAYVVHEGPLTAIKVRDLASPADATTIFADMAQRKGFFHSVVVASVDITFLGWAPDGTLVYGVNRPATSRHEFDEQYHVVNGDGHNDRVLLDSEALVAYFVSPGGKVIRVPRRGRPLGFSAAGDDSLLVEATGYGMVQTDVVRVDLHTGRQKTIHAGEGQYRFVYDGTGRPRVRETPRLHLRVSALRSAPPVLVRQRFEYHTPGAFGAWRELDGLPGVSSAKLGFSHDDDDYFHRRSFPLGFAADPDTLYFASNIGRDTFGVYALSLTTGRRTDFRAEVDGIDLALPTDAMNVQPLVLDRRRQLVGVRVPGPWPTTRWFDPELSRLQATADARFPDRTVRLIDWNDTKTRVLLLVTGPSDPGRYFIFDAGAEPEFTEVLRCRNVPRPDAIAPAEAFAFTTPAGVRLNGTVTLPLQPRLNPPPLVVLCPDMPGPAPALAAFDSEAQALAYSGFMVVRVGCRGTSGFGARHRDALQAGVDRVPLEDIRGTLAWLAAYHPYNRPRVALVGRGFGGYLAVRALELFPGEFRAAVAIDGATDPLGWAHDSPWGEPSFSSTGIPSERAALRRTFFGAAPAPLLESTSLDHDVARLREPVLLLQTPAGMTEETAAHHLRSELRRRGDTADYVVIEPGDAPGETARNVLLGVVEFLNAQVYDYRVDVGREREVK